MIEQKDLTTKSLNTAIDYVFTHEKEMITKLKTGENIGIYTYLYNNYRPIFLIFFSKLAGSTALFRVRTL